MYEELRKLFLFVLEAPQSEQNKKHFVCEWNKWIDDNIEEEEFSLFDRLRDVFLRAMRMPQNRENSEFLINKWDSEMSLIVDQRRNKLELENENN